MAESKNVSGAGLLCVGASRYAFEPDDKPGTILTGINFWFLETRQNTIGEPEKYYGEVPFKLGFLDAQYAAFSARFGFSSPLDLVGHRWDLRYNRFGKIDGLSLVG